MLLTTVRLLLSVDSRLGWTAWVGTGRLPDLGVTYSRVIFFHEF
jgi:hypothetical protein